jgi:membrane protease YdiL (CAAX protease family)
LTAPRSLRPTNPPLTATRSSPPTNHDMGSHEEPAARAIPAVVLINQEGVIGVIALIGLSLRDSGVWGGLAPRGSLASGVIAGMVVGGICAAGLWMLRRLPALADLEAWQQQMVRDWSIADAIVVALFSGLAEEALIRALLQPIIGLLPAALLFAALHIVPDRRLWLWPILACALGAVLGMIFEFGGYPAAAAAHIAINAFALLRLQRTATE